MNEQTIRRIILTATLVFLHPAAVFAQTVAAPSQSGASSRSSGSTVQTSVSSARSDARRLMGLFESTLPGSGPVSVVPAGEMTLDELTATTEDMTVMTRIFQTALGRPGTPTTGWNLGYGMPLGAPGTQSIYLEGYGALFMMKVDFPLSPGPEATEAPDKSAASDVDPVWQQTRQEIFAPEPAGLGARTDEEVLQYSKQKVEDLKTNVTKALKHAANIRNLASDESVVVTITSRAAADFDSISTLPASGQVVIVQDGQVRTFAGVSSEEVLAQMSVPTVLTIRAKRADIDAFAQGDLNLESFRNKVQMVSHPCLSGSPGRTVLPFISTGVTTR